MTEYNVSFGPPSANTRSETGATASYRGYRRQALYVLSRVLRPNQADLVFQPEGIEDLAIYEGKRLLEICQVKAVGEPLTLSHFQPSREDSFFRRAAARGADEAATLRVVSFGPVGPELAAAGSGDAEAMRVLAG